MKELDLSAIFKIVKENIITILISGAVLAAALFGYNTFFVAPTYMTTTTILVNNGGLANVGPSGDNVSGSDLTTSLELIETTIGLLGCQNMHEELANALDNEYSYEQLMSCFSFTPRGERSLLIDIHTYGKNPKEVKNIANTFLEIAPIYTSNNYVNVDIKILAEADKAVKVGPRTALATALGLFVGAFAAALVFFVISLFRTTIESEKDFKAKYDIPLLGAVPVFENKQTKGKRNEKIK